MGSPRLSTQEQQRHLGRTVTQAASEEKRKRRYVAQFAHASEGVDHIKASLEDIHSSQTGAVFVVYSDCVKAVVPQKKL
jgi:hypothetical protein